MMLKEEIAKHGIYAVMEKLTQMGFHSVEVSQIPMMPDTIAQMQRAQKELGMEISAMSCGMEDFTPEMKYPGESMPK